MTRSERATGAGAIAGLAGVASVLLCLGAVGWLTHTDEVARQRPAAGVQLPVSATPTAESALDIPSETIKGLAAFSDIEVVDTGPASASGLPDLLVSMPKALTLAQADTGLNELPSANIHIALARVTTHSFGQELEKDPSKPSNVLPALERAQVWVVTFTDVPVEVDQPRGAVENVPADVTATIVEFVSPTSGEVILGTSF